MEMAGPLVHHKVGWKHFKCRCTWDGQTHTDFASATHTHTHTQMVQLPPPLCSTMKNRLLFSRSLSRFLGGAEKIQIWVPVDVQHNKR